MVRRLETLSGPRKRDRPNRRTVATLGLATLLAAGAFACLSSSNPAASAPSAPSGSAPSASGIVASDPVAPGLAAPGAADAHAWVEETLAGLSLRERVAQLVMVWMSGGYAPRDNEEFTRIESLVRDDAIGGIVISLGTPLGYAARLNQLQSSADVPLLVAADFESGAGFRVSGVFALPNMLEMPGATVLPPAMAFGAADDEDYAYQGGPDHRHRGAGARRSHHLRAGARRQQQSRQSHHQHALLRGGSRARGGAGRGLHPGRARGRTARHRQALSRPRGHRHGLPPRASGDTRRPRAARQPRTRALPARDRGGR